MKKLISLLVCILVLSACSGERPLSKSAYTEDFAARLRQAAALKVEIRAELELKITTPAGSDTTAYLDNGYQEYCAYPKEREAIYARFIDSLIESSKTLDKEAPLDTTMITPIIKDRAWIAEIIASTQTLASKDKPIEFVYEQLNSELLIVYAEDSPKNLSYLTPKKLESAGLQRASLKELAVKNLRRLLTNIETSGGNGVYMMTAGGTYETSLLLFDDIWQERKLKVEGDYVVAVPSRDLLLITGSGNKEGIKKIRELAQTTLAKASYRLTGDLFVYRDNHFVKFED